MKNKKALLVVLAVLVLMTAAVAGTVAWLMDSTDTVQNTFTVGNIDIELTETGAEKIEDGIWENDNYQIIPGEAQGKDPKVIVKANSEDAYVFVKITEENNTAPSGTKYVTWEIADGWTKLEGVDGVYYRTVNYAQTASDVEYYVLKGAAGEGMDNGCVSYSPNLTKGDMDALYKEVTGEDGTVTKVIDETKQPKLTFVAYAIQASATTDVAEAWQQVSA